jgi:hypothetical protein
MRKREEKKVTEGPRFTGALPTLTALPVVKPNTWNPFAMTPFMRESLKHGLQTDGWLSSQSLLIWASDEKGKSKNIIIDGEHRWTVALELGFKEGPMVFLHKITEAEAKKLTAALNNKHGRPDDDKMGALLRSIQSEEAPTSLDVGIENDQLMKLLAEPKIPMKDPDGPGANGKPESHDPLPASNARMVQLYFVKETHEEFTKLTRALAERYNVKNTTDAVLEACRQAYKKK